MSIEPQPRPGQSESGCGPHGFVPAGYIFGRRRCRHCYLPESDHPVTGWVKARPLGDRTPPTSREER